MAEQCVLACLNLSSGAASAEFGACTARNCSEDRVSSILGSAEDPAATTNAPGAVPAGPMPWQAADIPACTASCADLTPGTNSIEYHSCVLEHCDSEYGFTDGPDLARSVAISVPQMDYPVPSPLWTVRTSDDGKVRIAAVTDPTSGNEFSVWCPVDGAERSFAVKGPRSPAASLAVSMVDLGFLLKFRPEGEYLRAALPSGGLEIQVLAKAGELSLALTAGYQLLWVKMNGADKALAEACP